MTLEPLKLIEIDNNNFSNLENILNIKNIQYYFPPLSLYGYIANKLSIRKRKKIVTKYFVHKILSKHHALIGYNHKYKCKYKIKNIFIKSNPILEPLSYIMEHYSNFASPYLPFIYDKKTIDKINNINSSCYIDSFFSILCSKLVERKRCPTFPLFYDTVSCISDKFQYDISEEYDSIKYEEWFLNNINRTFRVINNDILKQSMKKTTSFKNIGLSSPDNFNDTLKVQDFNISEIECSLGDLETIDNLSNFEDLEEFNILNDDGVTDDEISDNLSDISNNTDDETYLIELDNYPTQLIFLEKLDITFTELLQIRKYDHNSWDNKELLSIFFQICFGLAVAQKYYYFVHNDLHASNIMFKNTKDNFIYFCDNNNYFKIPTFNKITKIIDFGRATFYYNKRFFVSDVFRKNGDAEGQVTYPYIVNNKNNNIPNRSFDLSLLAVTIQEFFTDEYLQQNKDIHRLLNKWTTDKSGKNISDDNDSFDLYINIARNMENAIPIKQLNDNAFKQFIVNRNTIPKNNWIYYL